MGASRRGEIIASPRRQHARAAPVSQLMRALIKPPARAALPWGANMRGDPTRISNLVAVEHRQPVTDDPHQAREGRHLLENLVARAPALHGGAEEDPVALLRPR